MLQSMTGFGQSTGSYANKEIQVQIKTLNGKVTDVRFKIPNTYREKEMELRKMVLENSTRGKIDVNISINSGAGDEEYGLNTDLFAKYYKELKSLQDSLGIPQGDIMQAIVRIPSVIGVKEESMSSEEWASLQAIVQDALDQLNAFRTEEGRSLYEDLKSRTKSIMDMLKEVPKHEQERKTALQEKIRKNLAEFMKADNVDHNRFEQELLYYLEKLDINEEKVRLEQHLIYFNEELETDAAAKGKKLGFIAQEIGREINTMGSKAQFAPLQKIVVRMKQELEKIREQILNAV